MRLVFGQAGRPREATMRMRLTLGIIVPAFFIIAGAPAAVAGDTICDGTISLGTFDNIIVPSGASCTLNGTVVVNGNVQADGAEEVAIVGTSLDLIEIGGDVQITNSGNVGIHFANIGGNVQLEKNSGDEVEIDDSIIVGNLQCENNIPNLEFSGNIVDGDLNCSN